MSEFRSFGRIGILPRFVCMALRVVKLVFVMMCVIWCFVLFCTHGFVRSARQGFPYACFFVRVSGCSFFTLFFGYAMFQLFWKACCALSEKRWAMLARRVVAKRARWTQSLERTNNGQA